MFFPELIKSIKPSDKVLEIGPGGNPHPRSNVLLEYDFEVPDVSEAQRAYQPALKTDKPVVFYKGNIFPFEDKEFDYVICSHVIEHVSDLDQFLSEINRVGKAGYLEYPTIYYDYVYNIPEHVTFVKYKNFKIYWMNKNQTPLAKFQGIQNLFYKSLRHKYWGFVQDLRIFFVEGFEWFDSVESIKTSNLNDLLFDVIELPENKLFDSPNKRTYPFVRVLKKLKNMLKTSKIKIIKP